MTPIDSDTPVIESGDPTWRTIESWATARIDDLREQREQPGADLRKLDNALGAIVVLKDLLALPAAIKKERKRDPVKGDSFDIPLP